MSYGNLGLPPRLYYQNGGWSGQLQFCHFYTPYTAKREWGRTGIHRHYHAIPRMDTGLTLPDGTCGGTRTHDSRLKRALLYQLSYAPILSKWSLITFTVAVSACLPQLVPLTHPTSRSRRPEQSANNLILEKWSIYSIKPLQKSTNIYTLVYLKSTTGNVLIGLIGCLSHSIYYCFCPSTHTIRKFHRALSRVPYLTLQTLLIGRCHIGFVAP